MIYLECILKYTLFLNEEVKNLDLYEFSRILSRDDIIHLTKQLNEKIKNKTKISEITGLTRRTLYKYIDEDVKDIKEKAKFRLLGASFTYNREYTENFILKRLKILLASAAYSNLDLLYEKLLDTNTLDEFHKFYTKFISILQKNKHYLIQHYRDEILGLINYLEDAQSQFLKFYYRPSKIIEDAEKEEFIITNLIKKAKYYEYLIKYRIISDLKTTVEQEEFVSSLIFAPYYGRIIEKAISPISPSSTA